MAEGKRSSSSISERIQSLQGELSQSERRREELEAELRNTQEVKETLSSFDHNFELNCSEIVIIRLQWPNPQHRYRYRIQIVFASKTV